MRSVGDTTRVIDKAIQVLFHERKLIIPIARYKNDDLRGWRQTDKDKIIIDPDFNENPKNVHRDLLDRILRRLYIEHVDTYHNTTIKQQDKFIIIEIK